MVYTLLKSKAAHPKKLDLKEEVIQIIGLNEQQIKEYLKLIHIHRDSADVLLNKISNLKEILYDIRNNPSLTDSLTKSIGYYTAELDRVNINHINALASICTADQQEGYQKVVELMKERLKHRPRR
jgi:hypothetical protein